MFPVGQTASRSSMTDQVLLLWIALLVPALAVGDNLALGRPVWQSSTNILDGADKAVDGNTDGQFFKSRTCSHTNLDSPAPHWWLVDLRRNVRISSVVLYNRADCCSERLSEFHLELHNNNPEICGNVTVVTSIYQHNDLPAGPTTFTFDLARTARWVRIIKYGSDPAVVLCEVEVFGEPLPASGPCDNCQSSPVVRPQLPPLITHASLSVGSASPALCASLCLRHGQCLGCYVRPVVGGPPACSLLVPLSSGAPLEPGFPGDVTYFEFLC